MIDLEMEALQRCGDIGRIARMQLQAVVGMIAWFIGAVIRNSDSITSWMTYKRLAGSSRIDGERCCGNSAIARMRGGCKRLPEVIESSDELDEAF
jgi:hypothetical protein